MIAIRTTRGVAIAATVTTVVAAVIAQILTLIAYPISSGSTAYISTPIITFLTAFPISYFCWSMMRQNSLMAEELKRLVNRDRLTDAATRDFFFARMAEAPEAHGVSLMVDIDHFKRVNDTYGHLAGDKVIAEVAQVLRRIVRKSDIVCRFGGEEFVIFLDAHDPEDGFAVAERMRREVADRRMALGEIVLSVTVSIGGAPKVPLDDVNRSIMEADLALYRAKAQGRNRTVFGPGEAEFAVRQTAAV
jgi:diguanylate cyclase (GGDEF)-like protein